MAGLFYFVLRFRALCMLYLNHCLVSGPRATSGSNYGHFGPKTLRTLDTSALVWWVRTVRTDRCNRPEGRINRDSTRGITLKVKGISNFIVISRIHMISPGPVVGINLGVPRAGNASPLIMVALCPVISIFYLLSIFFFSSPNLSGRRLDVYYTSTHGVAL